MALPLGKVRRAPHSGNCHWYDGSRIHGGEGRSAKQGSRGPLRLSGSEPRLGRRNRSPSDSEEGWTMIIAKIETFPLRIPFKAGSRSDAAAWGDKDLPAAD